MPKYTYLLILANPLPRFWANIPRVRGLFEFQLSLFATPRPSSAHAGIGPSRRSLGCPGPRIGYLSPTAQAPCPPWVALVPTACCPRVFHFKGIFFKEYPTVVSYHSWNDILEE